MKKVFFSYNFADKEFVYDVWYFFRKQPDIEVYFWETHGVGANWPAELEKQIQDADWMIVFAGRVAGRTQRMEVALMQKRPEDRILAVQLHSGVPEGLNLNLSLAAPIPAFEDSPANAFDRSVFRGVAEAVVREIFRRLGWAWVPDDGIPVGYPFDYEKDIIDEYVRGGGSPSAKMRSLGCPGVWPAVLRKEPRYDSPLDEDEIGRFCGEEAQINVDPRVRQSDVPHGLALLEARPRKRLRYPFPHAARLGVGILVSGGIAPGINAVVDGIVKRHTMYRDHWRPPHGEEYHLDIKGFPEGFKGFFRAGVPARSLDMATVEAAAEHGGSILGTSRPEELLDPDPMTRERHLERIVRQLHDNAGERTHILYVIGGEGSMRAALALQRTADRLRADIAVVGVPKTMDNDILWIWQSFGFLSAVEKAREVILSMHTEVRSNPRLAIVQLFGSDSGFVASHAAYSTACDLVLIPEEPLTMDAIFAHIRKRLLHRFHNRTSPYGLVVMAETALPKDAGTFVNHPDVQLSTREREAVNRFLNQNRRVTGQTPDELRTAGLKMVSRILEKKIRELGGGLAPDGDGSYWSNYRVVANEPRHLIRSIRPSVSDVIFGERLGTLAVDNAMAGYRGFVVSQWLTEFVLVPLELVVLGRKRVPTDGIFWKSVRARTGQTAG